MLWIKELNPCAARRHACMESFALPGAHSAFCLAREQVLKRVQRPLRQNFMLWNQEQKRPKTPSRAHHDFITQNQGGASGRA